MTNNQDWAKEREAIRARVADYVAVRSENYTDLKERFDELLADLRRLLDRSKEDEREADELRIVLRACIHALHAYKHGNESPDLADEIIERAERLLK